jgi:hypothetical protein
MLIQQLNRNDAERVQLVVKNVDGSGSITTGMGAALVATAASGDGIGAVKTTATAGNANNFCGVALQDIPINGYGLVTAWGYAASVLISQSVGSWTITAGDVLIQSATQAGAFTSVVTNAALSTAMYKYVVAIGAIVDTISNPRPYISGIVRAL